MFQQCLDLVCVRAENTYTRVRCYLKLQPSDQRLLAGAHLKNTPPLLIRTRFPPPPCLQDGAATLRTAMTTTATATTATLRTATMTGTLGTIATVTQAAPLGGSAAQSSELSSSVAASPSSVGGASLGWRLAVPRGLLRQCQ